MAYKQCPSCGRKIAQGALYCIYCATRFEELPSEQPVSGDNAVSDGRKASRIKVAVIVAALVLSVLVSALFWVPPLLSMTTPPTEPTVIVTTTTRDPKRDDWLQTFTGRWVDENSVGKKDITKQGGALLFVHEIRRDLVNFDLLSYSGGEVSRLASVSNVVALLDQNTLHFSFNNDTQGHRGEGYLRFRDNEVDLEVLIEGEELLGEDEHSLALNTVFKRINLPRSTGTDLRLLTSLDKIKAVAGEPTEKPVTDEKTKKTTYVFGPLTAVVREDQALESVAVNYDATQDKSLYCYECVDGTMGYESIKSYFGDALHDYVEQPTDIRVLYYEFDADESVRFTFDAQDNLLIKIFCGETPLTTTASVTTTVTATGTTTSA